MRLVAFRKRLFNNYSTRRRCKVEKDIRFEAEQLLEFIFDKIMPQYGMGLRRNQKELSLTILRALQKNKLALCEAEVGTGKTHAYILALTVYNLFAAKQIPCVISTSTIALQKALTEEYIPQISRMLQEQGIIDKPLSFVIRKGKGHYICDYRLRRYVSSMKKNNKGDALLLRELEVLEELGYRKIDLDNMALTNYVKERVNVLHCVERCPYILDCRYWTFKRRCLSDMFDIQITNHNLLMADMIGKRSGKKSLFPEYGAIVFDEAHKLPDAARQMYCVTWGEEELLILLKKIFVLRNGSSRELLLIYKSLEEWNKQFFERLVTTTKGKRSARRNTEVIRSKIVLGVVERLQMKRIMDALERLLQLLAVEPLDRERYLQRDCEELWNRLGLFRNTERYLFWLEENSQGKHTLCAIPKDMEKRLYQDIWSRYIPMVFTSGTISVGGNLTHFRKVTGLDYAYKGRIIETSKKSPFDYRRQGLLYIPENMPFPNIRDTEYLQAVSQEILQIVKASHGHAMILFTSYWMMEKVYYYVKEQLSEYPLYMMGKGRLDTISLFRNSRNGVLFASDSAGEGIDLAGDILSCLIIVKLPFPIPDPVMDYQREQCEDVETYKQEVVVPQMLIKVRQWVGRGIRQESDTVAFSILDCRAASGGKYRNAILHALPKMPVTDRLSVVREFIRKNKEESYFN